MRSWVAEEGTLHATQLVPSGGICVGCDYQPTPQKGLGLNFIAFRILQMAGYKSTVKVSLV